MSLHDRAAQFAPFAALTGFDGMIYESERYTDSRPVLCEDDAAAIDKALASLCEKLGSRPEVSIVYFREDTRKSGGSFEKKTAPLRLIDTVERQLIFVDKTVIDINDIISIVPAEV